VLGVLGRVGEGDGLLGWLSLCVGWVLGLGLTPVCPYPLNAALDHIHTHTHTHRPPEKQTSRRCGRRRGGC
jgi:hypothetical protein